MMTCFEKNSCEKCGISKKENEFLHRWDGAIFCNKCAKEENLIKPNPKPKDDDENLSKLMEMLGLK